MKSYLSLHTYFVKQTKTVAIHQPVFSFAKINLFFSQPQSIFVVWSSACGTDPPAVRLRVDPQVLGRVFKTKEAVEINLYIPWEPTTFIFSGYNPYFGSVKPSFFMVLGFLLQSLGYSHASEPGGDLKMKLWEVIFFQCQSHRVRGFLKWWVSPTTMGFFLPKMIILWCVGGTTILGNPHYTSTRNLFVLYFGL